MADERVENPLRPRQRQFVHNMVYEGMDKAQAYAYAYNRDYNEDTKTALASAASSTLKLPQVKKYYEALMDELMEVQREKAKWTKEKAVEKLTHLVEKIEEDIYDNKLPITMARLQGIIMAAKELNSMHGYNQTNVKVEGCIVQITGEEKLED